MRRNVNDAWKKREGVRKRTERGEGFSRKESKKKTNELWEGSRREKAGIFCKKGVRSDEPLLQLLLKNKIQSA